MLGLMAKLVVVCFQTVTGVLRNTHDTVKRASQLIEFVLAELSTTQYRQRSIRFIVDQLHRLRRDVDDRSDVGLIPLHGHISALIPEHQDRPSNFAKEDYIRLCSINRDDIDQRSERYIRGLAHALLKTTRHVLLRSMRHAVWKLLTVRHHSHS